MSDRYELCEHCSANVCDGEQWCEGCKDFADERTQTAYEIHRAGNCRWWLSTLGCWYERNKTKPCAEHYSDCPLHSKDDHESTKKTDKDCPLHVASASKTQHKKEKDNG